MVTYMQKIKMISMVVFVFLVFFVSSPAAHANATVTNTNTSNAVTAVYGLPILVNVTNDNTHTAMNVDDFGFDVSQYQNITFYYLFDNGTGSSNDIQLMGSFNGWNGTDSSLYYNFTYTGLNNGTTAFKLYSLTYNVTTISVTEFKVRAFANWNYGEFIPNNNNHRFVVNGATIISTFIVNSKGDVITPLTDLNSTKTDIYITWDGAPVTIYLAVNVSNLAGTQSFGVGYDYNMLNGTNIKNDWSLNAHYNSTLQSIYGIGTATQTIDYYTVKLIINQSTYLDYKGFYYDSADAGAGNQYEPGLAGNHVAYIHFASDFLTPQTVTVNNVVTSTITTSIVSTTTQNVVATTTTVSTKSSPGFEVITVLVASGAFVLLFSTRRRRNK